MEEKTFKIIISMDFDVFGEGKTQEEFHLTSDQLLQFGRDFKKGILVRLGQYLLNKRHIVSIEFPGRDETDVDRYMGSVMSLKEWPVLSSNQDE